MLVFVNSGQNLFQLASKVLHTKVWLIFTRGRNCWLDSVHLKVWEVLFFFMALWVLLPLTQHWSWKGCVSTLGWPVLNTQVLWLVGTVGRLKYLVWPVPFSSPSFLTCCWFEKNRFGNFYFNNFKIISRCQVEDWGKSELSTVVKRVHIKKYFVSWFETQVHGLALPLCICGWLHLVTLGRSVSLSTWFCRAKVRHLSQKIFLGCTRDTFQYAYTHFIAPVHSLLLSWQRELSVSEK